MKKIKLLFCPDGRGDLNAMHLIPKWTDAFELEPIDQTLTYNPADCVLFTEYLDKSNWHQPWVDQGFKLIVNHLWDNYTSVTPTVDGSKLTLQASNWIWMNEAIWYKYLKYNQLEFNKNSDKFFLLLMNLEKLHRTQLFEATKKYHSISLVSYVDQGIYITGDCKINDPLWQRYNNVDWYDSTLFSLVAESIPYGQAWVTEKTFKPIAFQQPFVIWGTVGTLEYLQKSGFETFSHVIDESYDTIMDHEQRLEKIITIVESLYQNFICDRYFLSDTVTVKKLEHNFHHFYNQQLLDNMFQHEVIDPIIEFVETA